MLSAEYEPSRGVPCGAVAGGDSATKERKSDAAPILVTSGGTAIDRNRYGSATVLP